MTFTDMMECYTHPETQERRYPYAMIGKITTVENPASSSQFVRVKAQLTGMDSGEETDWLSPIVGGAIECTPNVSDMAIVWFEDGIPERGYYGCFPVSNTRNRPSEAMVLGNVFAGLFNNLVAQFNQLRSDMANHTHAFGTIACSTGVISGATAVKATTAVAANKVQSADGATVSSVTSDSIALSGKAKVR